MADLAISQAQALPLEIERNLYFIGTGAMQDSLNLIAHSLGAIGYDVEPTLDQHEMDEILEAFSQIVRAIASNHAEVQRMNDPQADAIVSGLEAHAPESLMTGGLPEGITSLTVEQGTTWCPTVTIKGKRGTLIDFLLTSWGTGDPAYDLETLLPYVQTLPLATGDPS